MIFTEKKTGRFLLLALGGFLTGLTLVFPEIGFLEWLTLVPFGIFLLESGSDRRIRLGGLYGYGLFFFMCYYLVVFHWFVNLYPLDFIDGMTTGGALAVVCVAWLGLSLLQALMGGLLFVVAGILFRSRALEKIRFLKPFAAAALWSVYEWTQTLGWWGVPWGRLPLGQSKYAVGLQTASLFGSYFITFLLVAVNLCVAYGLCEWIKVPKEQQTRKLIQPCCIAVTAMLVFQYSVGSMLWFFDAEEKNTGRAAAIQGNISSHEKWSLESTQKTKEIYGEYTRKAAEEGASLVVWPETALPYKITEKNSMGKYVSSLAKETGVTILVGCFTAGDENEYNSIVCFLPDGSMSETVYSKRRLVPFGEFVPMRGLIETLIPPLAELVLSGEDIAWGEGANVFELEEGNVGSLICFDSIYEELTRESVLSGAELICLSTNDSWFTDSAALYMHNAQAQLRAIESGRYVVRSANTGISTIISNRGEIIKELDPLVDGMAVEKIEFRDQHTLYTVIGNVFVYLCILALAGIIAFDLIWKIKHNAYREKRRNCEENVKKVINV